MRWDTKQNRYETQISRNLILSYHLFKLPNRLEISVEHDSIIAMLCAKFPDGLVTGKQVMSKPDFARFEYKMWFVGYILYHYNSLLDPIGAWWETNLWRQLDIFVYP